MSGLNYEWLNEHASADELRSQWSQARGEARRAESRARIIEAIMDRRFPPVKPRTHSEACMLADRIPTCQMAWMDAAAGPFKSRAVPENQGMQRASIGQQRGGHFKTSLTHDGMTVWRWGGVHPIDLANGVTAH